jgi:hypothetical protein
MPEIAVNRAVQQMFGLIEDANLSRNRLFIEGQGYDANTLSPLWMQKYHFNHNETYTYTSPDNFIDWGLMETTKGTVVCWGNGDTQHFGTNVFDSYWRAMDFPNFPVKRSWKTAGGKSYYTIPGRINVNSGDNYNNIHIVADDATLGTSYQSGNGEGYPSHFLFEDASNNRMWGFFGNRTDIDRVMTWTGYESGMTSLTRPLDMSSYRHFFMGRDDAGFLYFLSCYVGQYSQYNIYKINPSSLASTTVISGSTRGNTTSYRQSHPSNIHRDSATRRVFYGCHFDAAYSALAPIRYVWNPADGSITAANTTVNYAGSDTYATHAAAYTTEGADGYQRNSWRMQPWQFTVGGTRYITFWLIDKSAAFGSGASRWSSAAKRTMITYSIGAGTDDNILTYHSKVTFSSVNDIPRDILPMNATGTQMAVPITGALRFYTFNAVDGWVNTSTYPTEFRMIGLDQSNRLWGVSREKGYHTVHVITPSLPVTISVVMANTSYTYTGNNISTTAVVNAYDSQGARVAANVSLSIDGSGMIFTASNGKNTTVTTSNSANTTVSVTISSGGLNNIIASVDI